MEGPGVLTTTVSLEKSGDSPDWAGLFPHDQIAELLDRVAASAAPADATGVLLEIAAEAKRLRSTVLRVTAERMAEAEREADAVRAAAMAEAATIREQAHAAALARLGEAEAAGASVVAEARIRAHQHWREARELLAGARAQVDMLRDQVHGLFAAAHGVVPHLIYAGQSLAEIEDKLNQSQPPDHDLTRDQSETTGDVRYLAAAPPVSEDP